EGGGEMILRFGKHAGKELSEMPSTYLSGLFQLDWLWDSTRDAIRTELLSRGLPFGQHRGKRIDCVDTPYLCWFLKNCDVWEPYYTAIDEEIRNRREQNRRFVESYRGGRGA